MQTRIYRFEVLKGIANAVFQARDTVSEEPVSLYEWTPTPDVRDESRRKFGELSSRLECEAFTADISLYLAAKTDAQAKHDLAVLRAAGLFTGDWPTDPPPAPPPPPLPPVITDPQPVKTGISGLAVFGALIFAVAAFFIGMSFGNNNASQSGNDAVQQTKQQADGKIQSLQQAKQDADNQVQSLQQANRDATSKAQTLQTQLTDANTQLDDAKSQLSQYQKLHTFYVRNSCPYPMVLAVTAKNFNDQWTTIGWSHIAYNETRLVSVSSADDFYIHAEAGTYLWGSSQSSTSYHMGVLTGKFAEVEGQAQFVSDKALDTLKFNSNTYSNPRILTCG